MKNEQDKWISNSSQVAGASDASLKRGLLTSDGAGRSVKEEILNELLRRALNRAK